MNEKETKNLLTYDNKSLRKFYKQITRNTACECVFKVQSTTPFDLFLLAFF